MNGTGEFVPPADLGSGVHCVDLLEGGRAERTCAYIVGDARAAAVIETGAAPLAWRILKSLETLAIPAAAVEWVIVTHIHLDHAGGTGWLLERLPNAKVAVHPRGGRHLVDPSRLMAGARAVYGESFDRQFAPIVPVPAERVVEIPDGGHVELSTGRRFGCLHMAGHARHHFVVTDPASRGVFTGDNAGVRYPWFRNYGFVPALPTTSPSEFDPPELVRTMERIGSLGLPRLYFTHFSLGTVEELAGSRDWIGRFVEIAKAAGPGWESIRDGLRREVGRELSARGVPDSAPENGSLELDHEINAKGIAHYLQK